MQLCDANFRPKLIKKNQLSAAFQYKGVVQLVLYYLYRVKYIVVGILVCKPWGYT